MKKTVILSAIMIVAVTTFLLLNSDKRKIMRNLETLAEYSSTVQDEHPIRTMQNNLAAAKLCTDPFLVDFSQAKINQEKFDQETLTDYMFYAKQYLPNTTVTFGDINITFDDKKQATIHCKLNLAGDFSDERIHNTYILNIIAVKPEREWLFSQVNIMEP